MQKVIISPSLLSADFANLGKDVDMLNKSEADWLHFDVMDGVFVPNISFGFPIMKAVKKISGKPIDAHFMIIHPENYVGLAAEAGAAIMTIHQEVAPHLNRIVQDIHSKGMKAGVALNPSTPIITLEDIICDLDLVLLMSVNPGFGGQKFIENIIPKAIRLKQMIKESGSKALIEVDGGVNNITAPRLVKAGVDVLVSGSYIFKAENPELVIKELKSIS